MQIAILLLVIATLFLTIKNKKKMDELKAAVERETTVAESAITLIKSLAEKIASAGTDEVALKAIVDGYVNQETDALAAAVTANTPAA